MQWSMWKLNQLEHPMCDVVVLRHVAQPQLGFKSGLWWYHGNQTHLKELRRVWCCTVSTPHATSSIMFPVSPVFFASDINPRHDTPNHPPCAHGLCVVFSPRVRWEAAPASTVTDVQDKQDPRFVPLLTDGSLKLKMKEACGVICGEALFGDPSPPFFPLMNSLKGIWAEMQW